MAELQRFLSVSECSTLTGRAEQRLREEAATGAIQAVAVNGVRGGNRGKAYMIDITSLSEDAQIKYIAQMEGGKLGEADLVGYRERYGDEGIHEVLRRYNTVLACRAIEQDGKGDVTGRKAALAARIGVTVRTIYRWRDAYTTRGLAGLMDKIDQANKGVSKSMCLFAQDFVRANLFSAAKHTNRSVYEKLKALDRELECKACERCPHCEGSLPRRELALQGAAQEYALCDHPGAGLDIPASISSLNRYVQTIPADQLAYARYGKRYWEAKYMPKAQRIKPEKINECWFGDHHMFDCFVVDDDGRIVRPWMTAWSDATSGSFVGWCITTNPNSTTIVETFVRAIAKSRYSPFDGVPAAIYIDNGKDYRSKRFEGELEAEHIIGRINEQMSKTAVLQVLGVSVHHAQPYKAWSKTIERLFGVLESRYIRDLPGWCGGRPSERPEHLTRAYLEKLATQGKLLTLDQFERVMREQIIPAYHAERFEQPQAPIEIYQAGEKARDDMPGWDVLSLIRTEAVMRKVSYMGVKLHNQWYWDERLRHMVGEEVTVRYSKEDELTVTIVKDKHFVCEAALKDKLRLIGEDPEKVSAHIAMQKETAREVRAEITNAQRAVDVGLRNVRYEPIDLSAVGAGTITSMEYRKAAKAKAEKRAELAEYAKRDKDSDEAATDTVRKMFMDRARSISSDE